ncbi:hypothetical protein GCM10011376_08650 [Nocardioides flavus (ex Wang et al. 2016)]|uniref:Uncharacterized protein n=1 Tax=Nocardioides flavus (ex Wang et al. 2016) TaxID=2058780 RepID=A0ABQ3HGV1_9ACTN|nr:hypothetical protein [Nocardioides flavus (ex Wang et al. 2016)]GHE16255.1 hypothetical protein GCM10011376_08650 [Nocardioides flavus (ex Wang et al. 2016)]
MSTRTVDEAGGGTARDADDVQAALLRQLTERAAHDPVAGLLLARLQAQGDHLEPDPVDVLERRFEAALRANQQLREALVAANEMTAWVARLLGACPQCWGLVDACPRCRGRGGPGHRRPAVDELVDWLAPALRRVGLALVPQPGSHRTLRPLDSPDTTTPTKQEMP